MKNSLFNYAELYAILRQYYLAGLPAYRAIAPYAVINAHLESTGSPLRLAPPDERQQATETHNAIEKQLLDKATRDALYEDITEFTRWMGHNGYLEFNSRGAGAYRANDKLVRTPSLDFT